MEEKKILTVKRGSGITSCLMVRLSDYVDFWHKEEGKCLPDEIDSSAQWSRYRDEDNQDVSKIIFRDYKKPERNLRLIDFHHEHQYKWYNEMPLKELSEIFKICCPFSDLIVERARQIREMIGDRTVIMYRGNDKAFEIFRTPYYCMEELAKEVNSTNGYFVQTDEIEFFDFWKSIHPDTISYDNLPRIHKNPDSFFIPDKGNRIQFVVDFISALLAISSAKNIVMTTGNIGLTVALMRGKGEGIWQFHGNYRIGRKL